MLSAGTPRPQLAPQQELRLLEDPVSSSRL